MKFFQNKGIELDDLVQECIIVFEEAIRGFNSFNDVCFYTFINTCLDNKKTIEAINNFNPLEHRLELVGTYDEITYYNDSIATIPEAAIESVRALENVNTLIVGGNDRGVNQESLINFLLKSNVENIICLPKTGEYIYNGLKETNKNAIKVENMEEAVKIAKEVTKKNTICLLSPAASSYGYFKNFKERGNIFKKLIIGDKEL